jgi:DNA repair exonuclease SbcCD nuclease subunit
MRVHLISDVHLEFQKWRKQWDIASIDCDVHVLAGDIGNGFLGLEFALEKFTCPVIYVAGNHEFYNKRPVEEWWRKARQKVAGTHVHLLEDESVTINGTRFLGCSLWYNLRLLGDDRQEELGRIVERESNDYANIFRTRRGPITYDADPYQFGLMRVRSGDRLRWWHVINWHADSREFLETELARTGDWRHTVVVTHHAPSINGVEMEPVVDLDSAYASNCDDLVARADLWIHGHVHKCHEYSGRDGGRIVTNARGYKDSGLGADIGFVWNKVIQL